MRLVRISTLILIFLNNRQENLFNLRMWFIHISTLIPIFLFFWQENSKNQEPGLSGLGVVYLQEGCRFSVGKAFVNISWANRQLLATFFTYVDESKIIKTLINKYSLLAGICIRHIL